MELRDCPRLIVQRWATIVSLTLASIAVAALLAFRATPHYASTAQVYLSSAQTGTGQGADGGQISQRLVNSYAQLLRGDKVAARVVNSLDLSMTPEALANKIRAGVVPDTTIVSVTVEEHNPDLARQLTYELSRQFITYVTELETPAGASVATVRATVIDDASPPGSPVSPAPGLYLLLGALIGLVIGLATAIIRQLMDTSIKSPDDLQRTVDTPVLGTIAFDAAAAKSPLITSLGTHHPRVEAFGIFRTNLQFIDIDRHSKVFVVSSAMPGEGKSTTAANLAVRCPSPAGRLPSSTAICGARASASSPELRAQSASRPFSLVERGSMKPCSLP